ncbi:MAG: hypothetical protein Q4B36_04135 [Tissierellia bacterium]|nr:hypothetical protein [Tissierellia bacterium]
MFEVVNNKSNVPEIGVRNICVLCDKHDNNCSVCNEGAFDFVHCDNNADK